MSPAQASQAASNVSAIPLILASVLLGAVGQMTMKAGFIHLKTTGGWAELSFVQKLPAIFMNLGVLGGLCLYVIATFVWFAVLDKADLSFAYPFIALAYVVTVLGSYFFFHEHINPWKIGALALIILGVLCLAKGASEAVESAPPTSGTMSGTSETPAA